MNILSVTIQDRLDSMFKFEFVPQLFVSLLCMLIVLVFFLIIGYKASRAKVGDKPKGIFLLGLIFFDTIENFTISIMGQGHKKFTKLSMVIAPYVFICFIISLTGLPSPIIYLSTPLSLALITFFMVHYTAVQQNHWGYFKRYVEPVAVFLPINLISMWAPTLSLTLRMFGNAISGYCIMNLVYFSLETAANMMTGSALTGAIGAQSIFLAPIVTPLLHLYFDLFSGFIQTVVFTTLTLIYISQEQADPDENQVINEVLSSN